MKRDFIQSANKNIEADIVVVGAGLVGLAAAIACAKLGKKVVVVDAQKTAIKKQQAWDARIYALTANAEDWLQALGVWTEVDASRVNTISGMQLWDTQNNKLALYDHDANLDKLGVIVENQNLMYALNQLIKILDVTVITDAECISLQNAEQHINLGLADGRSISANLIIAADGADSWVRSQANISVKHKNFNQTAIVANFLAEINHANIARQWFAPHETLALLPLPKQHVSMVWALSTEQAAELLTLSGEALAERVRARSQNELGSLRMVGKVLSFSLRQQTAMQLIVERVVLVGDAAHQVHPMAGQGMNLGLRDVRQLQEMLTGARTMQDIGEYAFLRKYARARQADIATMNTLTSSLDTLFANNSAVIKKAVGWGFKQLNHQATIKKLLIQQVA
jgi:2-polyprenylphenol 6-hydroxylase